VYGESVLALDSPSCSIILNDKDKKEEEENEKELDQMELPETLASDPTLNVLSSESSSDL